MDKKHFHIHPPCALCELENLRASNGGIYASNGYLLKGAIFGRESVKVAEDLLEAYPEIARGVIIFLSSLQGVAVNKRTEEEPGKIIHEYRTRVVDGKKLSKNAQKVFELLSERWGTTEGKLIYYGSIDATPLYIRLISLYCERYGKDILDVSLKNKQGESVTVRESMLFAITWLVNKLYSSDIHLLEFLRMSPYGHEYQDWKDSLYGSHMHINGKPANYAMPIAPISVQGIAYDALMKAAALFYDEIPAFPDTWREAAKALQKSVLIYFWMPTYRYFADAIDRDLNLQPRQVQTITSDAATLLHTTIFDSLPVAMKNKFVGAIVEKIYHKDFVTDVGIRCRSLLHRYLMDGADTHGVWAVWAKETYDIAKGLERQGFGKLSQQLENRILNGVNISGEFYNYFYVNFEGKVSYDPEGKYIQTENVEIIPQATYPEPRQAWTISAYFAIQYKRAIRHDMPRQVQAVQQLFEEGLLQEVPYVHLLTNMQEFRFAFPREYALVIAKKPSSEKSKKPIYMRS